MLPNHLMDFVIIPTLKEMGKVRKVFDSEDAQMLMLATACHESECGKYLRQVNNRGGYSTAWGIYQCEPETHDWLLSWCSRDDNRDILNLVNRVLLPDFTPISQLASNLVYATIMCRLRYYLSSLPLPDGDDIDAIANYWGKFYQTGDKDLDQLNSKEKFFITHCKLYAPGYFG